MPILKGGAHFYSRKPKKGTKVGAVHFLHKLGEGAEAQVLAADIPVRSKSGRKRTVRLAAKIFRPKIEPAIVEMPYSGEHFSFALPRIQFRTFNFLRRLNSKYFLGLRLVNTMRLVEHPSEKQPMLLTSVLPPQPKKFSLMQAREYSEDMFRQGEVLHQLGFGWHPHLFYFTVDPQSKKGIAIILDYGQISRIKPYTVIERNAAAIQKR